MLGLMNNNSMCNHIVKRIIDVFTLLASLEPLLV